MIFTAFVYLAGFLLTYTFGLLPTSSGFPSDVVNAFATLSAYGSILSSIFPIGTLTIAVAIVYIAENTTLGFKTVKWIVSHLPFIGGRG